MNDDNSWISISWIHNLNKYYGDNNANVTKHVDNINQIKITDDSMSADYVSNNSTIYHPQITFKQFTNNELKQIDTILNNYNEDNLLKKNLFSQKLYDCLCEEDFDLFSISNDNFTLSCDCEEEHEECIHIKSLLYLIPFIIKDKQLLFFKLKGYHLKEVSDECEIRSINDILLNTNLSNFDYADSSTSDIPDLYNFINTVLEENPGFYKEDFKEIILTLYGSLKTYISRHIKHFSLVKNNYYNDFIIIKTKNKKYRITGIHDLKGDIKRKWGYIPSQEDIHINIDNNYQITHVDTPKKSTLNKYHLKKHLFTFLCELTKSEISTYYNKLYFLYDAFDLTLELINKHAVIPELFKSKNKYIIRWVPVISNKSINERITLLSKTCPNNFITYNEETLSRKNQTIVLISLIVGGLMEIYRDTSDNNILNEKNNHILDLFTGKAQKSSKFKDKQIINQINQWISNLNKTKISYTIYLEINDLEENKFNIKFLVYTNNTLTPLKELIKKTNDQSLLEQLKKDIKIIKKILEEDDIKIDEENIIQLDDFTNIFNNTVPLLETSGVKIILPESLKKKTRPQITLTLAKDRKTNNYISLDELLDFDWQIAIGDEKLTINEFKEIVKENKNLIEIRNQYVLLDEKELENIKKIIKKLPDTLDNYELLKTIITGEYDDIDVKVSKTLRQQIIDLNKNANNPLPKILNANLRPYQKVGYSWMLQNIKSGFGVILADDMGLGKTLQTLTLIEKIKEEDNLNNQKVLIIAPTSILINWQREINKFTPNLTSYIYHGTDRIIPEDKEYDIYITSYALIRRDRQKLEKIDWLLTVIDEAQNIKNPNTKQTRAIKSIKSKYKIALSGTPIENKLSEYWSIFDYINPGYLGTLTDFRKKYINPIENERDINKLDQLKTITQPFILRRLKTDKNIIKELPEKNTNNIYCNLTAKQAAIYQETLEYYLEQIQQEEGIYRRGIILQLINSLKQICNHPSQYLKSSKFRIKDSGKLQTLLDTLETIIENDEKVLIFTQYVEMGKILKKILEKKYDEEILFLHGSQNRKTRDKQITQFQEENKNHIFILSLKAGGTGLNLTAANNIIHYDLWWNPAVENQATDRAYRIGQRKDVMVYRLITIGTFEEQINDMLDDKKQLADITIGSGGQFITEMDDENLKEILRLRQK